MDSIPDGLLYQSQMDYYKNPVALLFLFLFLFLLRTFINQNSAQIAIFIKYPHEQITALPGSLARQPCPAALYGSHARPLSPASCTNVTPGTKFQAYTNSRIAHSRKANSRRLCSKVTNSTNSTNSRSGIAILELAILELAILELDILEWDILELVILESIYLTCHCCWNMNIDMNITVLSHPRNDSSLSSQSFCKMDMISSHST
jgi:hypothetical protein